MPPSALRKFVGAEVSFTRDSRAAGVDFTMPDGNVIPNTAIVVTILSTRDGINFEQIGGATFPGGLVIHPRLGVEVSDRIRFDFPVERTGDIRVQVRNLVALRTAITVTMVEPP